MRRRYRWFPRHHSWLGAALSLALAGAVLSTPAADGGAGELSLDRRAVSTLIRHGMPPTVEIRVGGLGTLSARLDPPRELVFRDGGIEAILPLSVAEPPLSLDLDVRFVPRVDREQGTMRLVAERVAPIGSPFPGLDLKRLVPALEVPRTAGGRLRTPAGGSVDVQVYVQKVRVLPERLVIEFGMVATPAD